MPKPLALRPERLLRKYAPRLALMVCFLPLLLLTAYNQPYWDDYSWAAQYRQVGVIKSISQLYNHSGGRFISNLFFTIGNPLSYGWLDGVKLFALCAIAGHLASIYLAVRTFTSRRLMRQRAAWVSLALWLTFVFTIPDIHSGVYWFSGLVVHQLACCLLVLVPVALVRASQQPAARLRWLTVAAIGTFVMAGTSELGVWLLGLVLLLGTSKSIWHREPRQVTRWGGLLLLLCVSFTIALVAPGNYERKAVAPAMPQSILALALQLGQGIRLVVWQPAFFALVLLPILFGPLAARLLPYRPKGLQLPLLVSAGVLLLGIVGGVTMLSLLIGPLLLARGINVLYWWMLLGWLVACWAAIPENTVSYGSSPPAIRALAALFLGVIFVAPTGRAWREALFEAPSWAAQSEARIPIYRKYGGQHSRLTVAPITHVTPYYVLIRGYDIQPYYGSPLNTATASYFELDSVRSDPAWPAKASF